MSDLISRQLLISKLANSTVKFATYDDWEHCCDVIQSVEREKGEWIFNPSDAIEMMFTKPKCSECGFESADGGNFCSNCGARMEE